eukprot:SAG11_NODE_459_length_9261_cov_7.747463_10_plen_179_part_00
MTLSKGTLVRNVYRACHSLFYQLSTSLTNILGDYEETICHKSKQKMTYSLDCACSVQDKNLVSKRKIFTRTKFRMPQHHLSSATAFSRYWYLGTSRSMVSIAIPVSIHRARFKSMCLPRFVPRNLCSVLPQHGDSMLLPPVTRQPTQRRLRSSADRCAPVSLQPARGGLDASDPAYPG